MEFDDNLEVAVDSPGHVVGSITSLATVIAAKAKTYSITLDTDFSYQEYGGPGETRGLDGFKPAVSLKFIKKTKLTDYTLAASFVRQDATTSEFDESGLTNIDGDRLTYSANASVNHQVNRSNNLIFSTNVTTVDFTETTPSLTPYFDANARLAWKHMMTRRTDATVSGSLGYYNADNLEDTESWIFRSNVDVAHRWTKRLTVTGGLGANFVRTSRTTGSEDNSGFSGNVGLNYRRKQTTIRLNLSHSLDPSSTGELENRTSASIGFIRKITRRSTFAVDASFGMQRSFDSSDNSRETLSISPLYTYMPARNWQTSLGYTYRYSHDTESAQSHKVFMSVSRSFTPLP